MKFVKPYTHALKGSYKPGDECPMELVEYLRANFPDVLESGADIHHPDKVADKMQRTKAKGKGAK